MNDIQTRIDSINQATRPDRDPAPFYQIFSLRYGCGLISM